MEGALTWHPPLFFFTGETLISTGSTAQTLGEKGTRIMQGWAGIPGLPAGAQPRTHSQAAYVSGQGGQPVQYVQAAQRPGDCRPPPPLEIVCGFPF